MSHASLLKTPLYQQHQALGARLVDFGGWALPVNYGSQMEEHHAVRQQVGMFDVSHMTVSDIHGEQTLPFLSRLLANDIAKASTLPGKALYSCMLNPQGGVIDDLIVYYLNDQHCRLVTNAGTRQKVMNWLEEQAQDVANLRITEQPQLALIAVQGPAAISTLEATLPSAMAELIGQLKRFQGGFVAADQPQDDLGVFIGRTGYTGEDGVEIILPGEQAVALWQQLLAAKVQPCGLGARDTLRLEAGMCLYGADLDEQHSPLDSGLGWTVATDDQRDFIGRSALSTGPSKKMIGLILEGKGVLRGHQPVYYQGQPIGEITSGTFSPTLGQSIALARIEPDPSMTIGSLVQIEIRNKPVDARVSVYPFVK